MKGKKLKIRKNIAGILGTLVIAGGLLLGTAAPANAWGSGSMNRVGCTFYDVDDHYAGSSYTDTAGQIVYVSMAAPTVCVTNWSPTGYVQTRKNPSGLTGATNCTAGSCSYVLQTTYGAKRLYWGGVHSFYGKKFTT
ncbi:hypothetical protein [Microbacterium phyllosphaerae]|uniref:hypothetical protein n=1 Tax=Microbacterium phyllosphaerae TaxID=124798 RepID=UPI002166E53C|nr:hypothetical protein [Microbacterium phyllosphaerae]MCS3442152.1 hypothetical protein [Microbacterium phyllosphaerae]